MFVVEKFAMLVVVVSVCMWKCQQLFPVLTKTSTPEDVSKWAAQFLPEAECVTLLKNRVSGLGILATLKEAHLKEMFPDMPIMKRGLFWHEIEVVRAPPGLFVDA